MIGYWLLVIGERLLVYDYYLSRRRPLLPISGRTLRVIGDWLLVYSVLYVLLVFHVLLVIGYRTLAGRATD